MARSRPKATKYPGVMKRTIHARAGGKGQTVYDLKIGNDWFYAVSSNLEEARRERERLVVEAQGGSLRGRQQTLRAFTDTVWQPRQEARVSEGKLRPQVLANHKANLSNHVLPRLGDRRLGDLGVQDVQALLDKLRADGKARYTVLNIRNALSSVLALAKSQRIIPFNPAAEVDAPAARREREPLELTVEQVERLAAAAITVDDRNLIRTAAYTGLRFSEVIALRWTDVQLEPGRETLRVAQQLYRGKIGPPKTRSGLRAVPLLEPAAEALRSQLRESKRPNPQGLFFPNTSGGYLHASNWNRREWKAIRAAAGLPEVHFHDLRSFFVSHVRSSNLPSATTLALVGHSDARTHDDYTYLTEDAEARARAALAAVFATEDREGE